MMYKPPISLVLDKSSKPSPIQESGCGGAAAAPPWAVGGSCLWRLLGPWASYEECESHPKEDVFHNRF